MDVTVDLSWQESAMCVRLGIDPDDFFPPDADDINPRGSEARRRRARAQEACTACPVKACCRAYADAFRTVDGIWGGETANQRKNRWKQERAAHLAVAA